MAAKSTAYRFDEYLLEPDEHRLTRDGKEIPVRPKTFQVLKNLVEKSRHLVTKESLLDSIWPNTYVTEKVLTQSISEIRALLDDRGDDPLFIRTIPRVGYKFIAEVVTVAPEGEEFTTPITAHQRQPSIAVLPFKDMSPEGDQDYFCEGVAEEIINALAQVEGLRVVARTSSFSFQGKNRDIREIGERLNAQVVLEGSVRKGEGRLRIAAQLLNAASGYHLWSEQYDCAMDDVLGVQGDIAAKVVDGLNIDIDGSRKAVILKRHTENPEAYHLFLKGCYFMSREGPDGQQKAATYYRSAISEDPEYALAYASLSICNSIMWTWDYAPSIGTLVEAKQLALRAIELDETLGNAHSALGFARMYLDWDWHGARSSLVRARQLSPGFEFSHNLYAIYCTAIGKKEEAVAACRKALELDPLSPQTNTYLGMFLLRAGRVEKALHQFKEALELDPDQPQAHWLRGQALVISRRHREGIQEIEEALSLSDENPMILAGLGWAHGVAGRRDDAIQVLRALEKRSSKEYIRPYLLAKVYCGMGETEEAFAHLAMAYEERDRKLVFITTDETLADLNFDNRFGGLLKKMGLSEIL